MSLYHCSISNVSRGRGSATTATLSYITGRHVRDERLGKTFYGFGRTERIEQTGTMLPAGALEIWRDPAVMLNSIEMFEKSDRARTGKKIEVAFPRELTPEQRIEVIESYIEHNITENGYAAAYALHNDEEGRNPHCHILIPNRPINQETGEWEKIKAKKEYAKDENGERIPLIDPETGKQKVDGRNRKQWKRISVEQNLLDKKETLQNLRREWANECNKYLTQENQIDHRSYSDRGIEKIPTIHEGYAAREIEKRGGVSDRVEINREISRQNNALEELARALGDVAKRLGELLVQKMAELQMQRGEEQRERVERNERVGTLLDRWRNRGNGSDRGAEQSSGRGYERERPTKRMDQNRDLEDARAAARAAEQSAETAAAERRHQEIERQARELATERSRLERERKAKEEKRRAAERRRARESRSRDDELEL